jgi:general secretion pathway protein I
MSRAALRNPGAPSEQSRIFESRAKKRALNKVPHLQSSPIGRGEEASRAAIAGCKRAAGFTLLEVMIAIAILGTALAGLLALHHQSIQSVIRAQDFTRASMLAQAIMTEAELERFPDLGTTQGNFQNSFPGQFQDFRWQRLVTASGTFPDVREVKVLIVYGPNLGNSFTLAEFLHSPVPPDPLTGQVP